MASSGMWSHLLAIWRWFIRLWCIGLDLCLICQLIKQFVVTRTNTVYPNKYAHGFCFAVLCCGYTLTDFPISIKLTSLALWQSNDCPSASKATLMNMDKYFMWIHYERLHNHNKAKHNKTVCIFLGIYCTSQQRSIYSDHCWVLDVIMLRNDMSFCCQVLGILIWRKPFYTAIHMYTFSKIKTNYMNIQHRNEEYITHTLYLEEHSMSKHHDKSIVYFVQIVQCLLH